MTKEQLAAAKKVAKREKLAKKLAALQDKAKVVAAKIVIVEEQLKGC